MNELTNTILDIAKSGSGTEPAPTPIARFDWRSVMNATADTPAATIKVLDDYFSQFVAVPLKEVEGGKPEIQSQNCVGCGEMLTGFAALLGRGGFRWGLAHGHGNCSGCGWPAVAHHFIKDEHGEDVVTLRNFILQLHPDFVERRKRA